MIPEELLTRKLTKVNEEDSSTTAIVAGLDLVDNIVTTQRISLTQGLYYRKDTFLQDGPTRRIHRSNIDDPISLYSIANRFPDIHNKKRISAEVKRGSNQLTISIFPTEVDECEGANYHFTYNESGHLRTANIDLMHNLYQEMGVAVTLSPNPRHPVRYTVASSQEEEERTFRKGYGEPLLVQNTIFQVNEYPQSTSFIYRNVSPHTQEYERAIVPTTVDVQKFLVAVKTNDNKTWLKSLDQVKVLFAHELK